MLGFLNPSKLKHKLCVCVYTRVCMCEISVVLLTN